MSVLDSTMYVSVSKETLESLEYPLVVKHVGSFMGYGGRNYLKRLRPWSSLPRILSRQAMLRGLLKAYEAAGRPSLHGLPDVQSFIIRGSIAGAWLWPEELLQVAHTFSALVGVRSALRPYADEIGRVWNIIRSIPTLKEFRRNIKKYIYADGQVNESASPEYRRITTELRKLQGHIETVLHGIATDPKHSAAVQDLVLTRRERRWVILVRADRQGMIPGLVLGTSGSGASVYLEPYEVVTLNNRYVILENERQAEVIRILQRLTQPLQAIPNWATVFRRIALLDFLLGIARWANECDAHLPRVGTEGELCLIAARHPLLDKEFRARGKTLIPLDLALHRGVQVMVLTGPNAGGKTVALKTIGLLALLSQAGLPIPASPESSLPVFTHILADIGDRQDLLQNLSTFAAHIRRISSMIEEHPGEGLYLIDELGSGTDPVEGAALSRVVLEVLRKRSGKVIAITHLPELKWWAVKHPDILSASMEFDAQSLSPTYRLVPHTMGASHALEIAQQMGIPGDLIQRARSLMRPEEAEFAEALHKIEAQEQLLKTRMAEIEELHIRSLKDYEKERKKLSEERIALSRALERLDKEKAAWTQRLQQEWETLQKELRDPSLIREARRRFRAWMREKTREIQPVRDETTRLLGKYIPVDDLVPGTRVRVRGTHTSGKVNKVNLQARTVELLIEGKKVQLPLNWLESTEVEEPNPPTYSFHREGPDARAESVINLLGFHIEDARVRLEQVLDRAYREGLASIRVIHGYQPGLLKAAVLEFLHDHPWVDHVEDATLAEGGSGASIVHLRQPK